jgi:hypothetical protein
VHHGRAAAEAALEAAAAGAVGVLAVGEVTTAWFLGGGVVPRWDWGCNCILSACKRASLLFAYCCF